MFNYLLYLDYKKFDFLSNLFTIEHLKDLAVILSGLGSVATIILVYLSYKQFKIFIKEYKEKTQPKIIPYIDVIADGNSVSWILLKFYNASNIVATNIGIEIDEKWLDILEKVEKDSLEYKLKEKKITTADILRELKTYKNIYITNRQDHSYVITSLKNYNKINSRPIEIIITYYEYKNKKEKFVLNLRSIGNKAENVNQATLNELNKIDELSEINKSLKKLIK